MMNVECLIMRFLLNAYTISDQWNDLFYEIEYFFRNNSMTNDTIRFLTVNNALPLDIRLVYEPLRRVSVAKSYQQSFLAGVKHLQ